MIQSNTSLVHFVFELFNDSKFFLNEAKKFDESSKTSQKYLRASILSAWAGFEGWINKTCFDFAKTYNDLTEHEIAFLLEKRVELKDGNFKKTNSDKFESVENRLEFLLKRIGNYSIDKSTQHWNSFKNIKKIRDTIVHPKGTVNTDLNIKVTNETLQTLNYYLELTGKKLYGKKIKKF